MARETETVIRREQGSTETVVEEVGTLSAPFTPDQAERASRYRGIQPPEPWPETPPEKQGPALRLPGGEEISLSQVSVLRLGPNDCLVVKASKQIAMEAEKRIRYALRQTFGEMVRFLILGPELDVEVVRTETEG